MRARILRALRHLKAAKMHLDLARGVLNWNDQDDAKAAIVAAGVGLSLPVGLLKGRYAEELYEALQPAERPRR